MPSNTSHFPFAFLQFGIQFTNFCNYACAHCGTSSSPHASRQSLSAEFACSLFPVLKRFGFTEVTFTGGEALLFRGELFDALRGAGQNDLSTKLISNGAWAHTLSSTRKMMRELSRLGLGTLAISFDKYRRPHGGRVGQVRNIVDVSNEFKNAPRVIVYSLEADSVHDTQQEDVLRSLREFVPPERLYTQSTIPIGRGASLRSQLHALKHIQSLNTPCHQVFAPFLSYRQDFYRCCTGLSLGTKSPLFLGKITSSDDLACCLEKLIKDPVHKALCTLGPVQMFGGDAETTHFTSLCEYCVSKMNRPEAHSEVHNFCSNNSSVLEELYEFGKQRFGRK